MEDLKNLLKQTKIEALLEKKKLVTLDSLDTIEYAIKKLSENKILSAPVYKDGSYLGTKTILNLKKTHFFYNLLLI